MKPESPQKPEAPSAPASSELVVCEDPATGEIIVRCKGSCPIGYIEKIRDKAMANGLTFLIPRVKTREVDDAEEKKK